ncbi:hypothetical protein AA103196_2828 [Ameyamaea chiangmaiensis NBRC 103196]|nr:hypothetical protein AA103196_2828 [Ameyamaea chiangmaiensis NBRC 103196]
MTIDVLSAHLGHRDSREVEEWIAADWVRPHGTPGHYAFAEIDVARAWLIHDLRHDLGVSEDAVPLVLHLVDQLYDSRRMLDRLRRVLVRPDAVVLREQLTVLLRHGDETP